MEGSSRERDGLGSARPPRPLCSLGVGVGEKGPEQALSYTPFLTAAFLVPSPLRLPPPRSRVAPEAQDPSLLRC